MVTVVVDVAANVDVMVVEAWILVVVVAVTALGRVRRLIMV